MFRIIHFFLICFVIVLFNCNSVSAAWPWGDANTLVTINGEAYTPDDYKRWWGFWKESRNAVPEDPQDFIEWKLFAQEALIMELDQTPSFKRKVHVFLKSRTRMQLKYEEVDSRMQPVSEPDIRARYDRDYSPISLGTSLYFDTMEKASTARREIVEGTISVNVLLHRKGTEGGPVRSQKSMIRPLNYRAGKNPIGKAVQGLAVGEVSDPLPFGHLFVLFVLEEQIDHDPDDLDKRKKSIRDILIKARQAELTSELLTRLQEKYEVKIDEDLLAGASADLSGEILKQPIVTTSKGDIPLYLLVKDIRKEDRVVPSTDEKVLDMRKRGLLNGMIMEYLITWESLDRHYEEKPPLKWSYEFYKENRLIVEFESRLIKKQISLSSENIEQYYNRHIERYAGSPTASIALVEEKEELINKIWKEINIGQDFFIVAKRYFTKVIPVKEIALDKLSPELLAAVEKLTVGEVSSPFKMGNDFGLVKLIDLHPAAPLPLLQVKKTVKKELYTEKFDALRKVYMEKLIEQSEIELNQRAWNRLKKDIIADSKAN
jgi:hypothetical protein